MMGMPTVPMNAATPAVSATIMASTAMTMRSKRTRRLGSAQISARRMSCGL